MAHLDCKPPEVPDWASALAALRNDLSHGNRRHDSADLDEISGLLDKVVRAHLVGLLLDVQVPDRDEAIARLLHLEPYWPCSR